MVTRESKNGIYVYQQPATATTTTLMKYLHPFSPRDGPPGAQTRHSKLPAAPQLALGGIARCQGSRIIIVERSVKWIGFELGNVFCELSNS